MYIQTGTPGHGFNQMRLKLDRCEIYIYKNKFKNECIYRPGHRDKNDDRDTGNINDDRDTQREITE